MKKSKIYLDTSVISYLDQQDSPEKMEETRLFWSVLKLGEYAVYISYVNVFELARCSSEKQLQLAEYLRQIDYTLLEESKESEELALEYISKALLPAKCMDDCRHIALATMNGCGYIGSWNFRHMANIHTVKKLSEINRGLGYGAIEIHPPTFFI